MKHVILLAAGLLISVSSMAEVCPLKAALDAKTKQADKEKCAREATLALNPNAPLKPKMQQVLPTTH